MKALPLTSLFKKSPSNLDWLLMLLADCPPCATCVLCNSEFLKLFSYHDKELMVLIGSATAQKIKEGTVPLLDSRL